MITKLARLGEVSQGEAPKGSVSIPVAGGSFALPLAGIVDVSAEKARLEKSLGKLAKELGGLRGPSPGWPSWDRRPISIWFSNTQNPAPTTRGGF